MIYFSILGVLVYFYVMFKYGKLASSLLLVLYILFDFTYYLTWFLQFRLFDLVAVAIWLYLLRDSVGHGKATHE